MAIVNLSPIFNGWQGFTAGGLPLAGGLLNTYQAGTSTPQATYTTNAGSVTNSNPIVLGPDGRPPFEIWLVQGQAYAFVLTDSLGLNPLTYDNISGVNDQTASIALDTAIRADLANNSTVTKGANLIGYAETTAYATAGTLGKYLKDLVRQQGTRALGIGLSALISLTSGADNLAIGFEAGKLITTGFGNVIVGPNAGTKITTPGYSTLIGAYAGQNANRTSDVNLILTAVGAYALNANTDGQYNTAVGGYAGQLNTTGYFNTWVGQNSGATNLVGFSNTAVGHSALRLGTGSGNTAVGDNAGELGSTAATCTYVGFNAGQANQTGSDLVAVGAYALAQATAGPNIGIGRQAAYGLQTGINNVIIGNLALLTASGAASRNVCLGNNTLNLLTTNSDSTAVGHGALAVSINGQQTAIGSGALGAQTNGGGTGSVAAGYNAGANMTTGSNNVFLGAGSGTDAMLNVTTASNQIVMGNNAHTNATIKVAWTVTSDARDKTDHADIDRGLDFILSMKPKSYKLMDRETQKATTGKRYGFFAQDILAEEGDDHVLIVADDPENLKMNESMMAPILVKALQESWELIDALSDRVRALETA